MDWKTEYARGYLEIDLDRIRRNMDNMKANLDEKTKMIGVIKTDGYGHGAVPIAAELEPLEYMYGFAVATVEEAHILRMAGVKKPILILGYTFPYSYPTLVKEEIRPTVFREDTLKELSEVAVSLNTKIKVHIKLDTGMSRIGVLPDESGFQFVEKALQTEGIEVEGIFTHFATSDYADKRYAYEQLEKFQKFCLEAEERFHINFAVKHCSNSAGIIEMREANMDVVRAGITLYGLSPSDEVEKDIVKFEPALSFKSTIVYVKTIPAGTAVGYGRTYIADKERTIATIPLGYGDGYPRGMSNKGYVLIHGKRAPIIGRVCMDQFMVDVTDIPGTAVNDEVTLIGTDGAETITMEEIGEVSGRFNYELACNLGKRVPRVYKKNGKVIKTKNHFADYE
ncbi:MAG: alanine racemase [Lachnospiraceae bacterium]|nr:alanine racemase [Lachnospiraceae bacterium]